MDVIESHGLKLKPNRKNPSYIREVQGMVTRFQMNQLGKPYIPKNVSWNLCLEDEWFLCSHSIKVGPSAGMRLRHGRTTYDPLPYYKIFKDEKNFKGQNFFALQHSGHGINSYILSYFYFNDALNFGVLIQVSWGGVYTNNVEKAKLFKKKMNNVAILDDSMKKYRQVFPGDKRRLVVGASWRLTNPASGYKWLGSKHVKMDVTSTLPSTIEMLKTLIQNKIPFTSTGENLGYSDVLIKVC